MRTPARSAVSGLPARKRVTLFVLFVLMCGGVVAGGSALG